MFEEGFDELVTEGGVVGAGEQVELGELEATPRRAKDAEPAGAVGGVEQGACEGEEVEDLGALAERLDLDGAVGDGRLLGGCHAAQRRSRADAGAPGPERRCAREPTCLEGADGTASLR